MKKYGLIGKHLSHSFSKNYFQQKIENGLLPPFLYENYELASINDLTSLLHQVDLAGFNVTIPYKKSILPLLHNTTTEASQIGAVNCVRINNGNLTGHNTDYEGFKQSITPLLTPLHKKALVLGNGGATQAVIAVLQSIGIHYLIVARNPDKNQLHFNQLDDYTINEFKLIINCTPLGMYPSITQFPPINYEAITTQHLLFDLIYNPVETQFLKQGKKHNAMIKNGYEMLCLQADASFAFWNKA